MQIQANTTVFICFKRHLHQPKFLTKNSKTFNNDLDDDVQEKKEMQGQLTIFWIDVEHVLC